MRIGIVTFFGPYGGALQCFALQHVLSSMGHEVYVINRKWGAFRPVVKKSLFCGFKHKLHKMLVGDPFEFFYDQNYKFTTPVTSNEVLLDLGTKKYFDAILVGSDQPWNPECIKTMGYYFYLDWVSPEVKKYAYAVSFGKDSFPASEKVVEDIKCIINTYCSVSVREKSGIKICNEIFNIKVQQCLDPTLLLTGSDYNNLITDKEISRDYVCEFFLDHTSQKHQLAIEIAKKENLSLIDNNPPIPQNRLTRYFYHKRSISQWLRNIRDAKYVITDSFHGTVFSLLFHKQFISINNKKRGSARFESLLSALNIINRLQDIDNLNVADVYSILHEKIDYNKVDFIIADMKSSSLSFLKNLK